MIDIDVKNKYSWVFKEFYMRSKAQLADLLFKEFDLNGYILAVLSEAGLDVQRSKPEEVKKVIDDVASGNFPGGPYAMLSADAAITLSSSKIEDLQRKYGVTKDELEKNGLGRATECGRVEIYPESIILARRDLVRGGMIKGTSET